jgi:prevent-host-death family protein
MITISASEAKSHFGNLLDKVQKEPVTIEKQGRPIAVVISYPEYQRRYGNTPSNQEKEHAITFLNTWSKRPSMKREKEALNGDIKAQVIWDKYTQEA